MRLRLHPARKGYMATSSASSPHLVTSQNLTVAQVFLRYLALEGVDKVFGIPGGGIANLLVEFKNQRDRFTYIVCRHETGAAYIADGYYRATGKLAVVMVTTGPGATNALTGAMNAQAGGSAMLTITGEVAEQFFGKGYLQEGADLGLDISAIYKAATAYSVELTDQSDVQVLIEQALRDALSIPRNATHLSVPNNVPTQVIPSISIPTSPAQYRATPDGVSRDRVHEALQQLLSAKRPLIFLGSGCREALQDPATIQALTHFAERYAIPIMTTPDGKGIFPETHELSLRVYGCASCLWPAMWMQPAEEPAYDALLVLGTGLRGLSTNNWNPILVPSGSFIQVDLDQNAIARAFPITLGVVGEVGAFIREAHTLAKEIPPVEADVQNRRKILAAIKQYSPFYSPSQYASNSAPIEPAALVRVLQQTLPHESTIMLDAGNCVGWGLHYFVVDAPMQIHSALAMGPMGFAVGAVIGAKMGCPDRTCVGLVGDGAFMMHGSEVSTAATYNVGAIWVVLQDDDLHMVTQGMTYLYPDAKDPDVWDHLYQLGNPDLVKFSEGLGADAYLIEDPAQLTALMPTILDRANNHNKPQVIVARINRTSLDPFFPPRPPAPKPVTQ
jgi:acetolactate synthase I/II/III large subunit